MGVDTGLLLLGFVVASSTLTVAVTVTGRDISSKSTGAVKESATELLPILKLKGRIIATRAGDGETVPFYIDSIKVPLTTYGATPVALDPTSLTISYYDRERFVSDVPWSAHWIRQLEGDGDKDLIVPGELVEVSLDLSTFSPRVSKSGSFHLQLKPVQGAVTTISSTIPARLSPVNTLAD